MPYYLHAKLAEPEHGTPYDTATIAHAANENPATHKVTFIPSEDEKTNWRQREDDRFDSGQYVRVPWYPAHDMHASHYAHLSISHPGLVAYTKSEEHGFSDRQTRVRPGKYLEEFYAHEPFAKREQWIRACAAHDPKQLHFAVTPDEIERVYMGGDIRSCMGKLSHNGYENTWDSPQHPCRVYGNSDLQLAYLGEPDAAIARAIVWPERKRYSRTYGPQENTLRALLEDAGYSQGSLSGAKIRRVPCNDGLIVPYVDGISCAHESGKWLVLGSGPIATSNTNGVAAEEDDSRTCDNCGDSYRESDSESTEYCQSCYDESYCCVDCNETYFADGNCTDGGMLCESCYRARLKTCAVCEREWLEEAEFSRTERRDRQNNGTSELCRRCQDNHTACEHCGDWFVSDDHDRCLDCRPDEEDDSEDTDTPAVEPAAVPTVRYMRNSRMEFVVNGQQDVAYLMLDAIGVLWAINKDGTTRRVTNNWNRDWPGFISSGGWQYFDPLPCQDPSSSECEYPIRAYATIAPNATPATTPATIGGAL